jgi:hypothetical protein
MGSMSFKQSLQRKLWAAVCAFAGRIDTAASNFAIQTAACLKGTTSLKREVEPDDGFIQAQ